MPLSMAVEKLSLLALNETPKLLSALFTCYPDLYPGFTAFNSLSMVNFCCLVSYLLATVSPTVVISYGKKNLRDGELNPDLARDKRTF